MGKLRRLWAKSEIDQLSSLYPDTPTKEIAKILNRHEYTIYNKAYSLGLKKSAEYLASPVARRLDGRIGKHHRFDKGHVPWNKNMKGIHIGGKETQFNKGHVPANLKPIGHERTCSKDGYILIKVDEVCPYTGFKSRYKKKHIVVWEEHNGSVPKGKIIVFKDRNKLNFDPDNLECISRAENMRRNTIHNYPVEVKKTIRLAGKLKRTITGIENG